MQSTLPCTPLRLEVDIRNGGPELDASIRACSPDVVVHLAAQSLVPRSIGDPVETFDINFMGTFNLLQALKAENFGGTFLFVGSGDTYGLVPDESLPISEDRALRPRNPYAVSKVAAEALCFQWSTRERFRIVMARPFNHIGPGQRKEFAISGFAKQIVEIKRGLRDPVLTVGDIDVSRDLTDVRDIVRAYKFLIEMGENGEVYNVCSGKEYKIRDLLEKMLNIAGVKARIQQDPALFPMREQRRQIGCNLKLRRLTGWQPQFEIDETLTDILNHWERNLDD